MNLFVLDARVGSVRRSVETITGTDSHTQSRALLAKVAVTSSLQKIHAVGSVILAAGRAHGRELRNCKTARACLIADTKRTTVTPSSASRV